MRILGNIIWHIPFFGFITSFVSFLVGFILVLTIVGAPIGLGLIELSKFLLAPFTRSMISKSNLKVKQNKAWKAYGFVVRICYFPFGLFLTISTIFQIIGLCISIIGIPVAIVLAKSLSTYFNPVNKKCVPKTVAEEVARRLTNEKTNEYMGMGHHSTTDKYIAEEQHSSSYKNSDPAKCKKEDLSVKLDNINDVDDTFVKIQENVVLFYDKIKKNIKKYIPILVDFFKKLGKNIKTFVYKYVPILVSNSKKMRDVTQKSTKEISKKVGKTIKDTETPSVVISDSLKKTTKKIGILIVFLVVFYFAFHIIYPLIQYRNYNKIPESFSKVVKLKEDQNNIKSLTYINSNILQNQDAKKNDINRGIIAILGLKGKENKAIGNVVLNYSEKNFNSLLVDENSWGNAKSIDEWNINNTTERDIESSHKYKKDKTYIKVNELDGEIALSTLSDYKKLNQKVAENTLFAEYKLTYPQSIDNVCSDYTCITNKLFRIKNKLALGGTSKVFITAKDYFFKLWEDMDIDKKDTLDYGFENEIIKNPHPTFKVLTVKDTDEIEVKYSISAQVKYTDEQYKKIEEKSIKLNFSIDEDKVSEKKFCALVQKSILNLDGVKVKTCNLVVDDAIVTFVVNLKYSKDFFIFNNKKIDLQNSDGDEEGFGDEEEFGDEEGEKTDQEKTKIEKIKENNNDQFSFEKFMKNIPWENEKKGYTGGGSCYDQDGYENNRNGYYNPSKLGCTNSEKWEGTHQELQQYIKSKNNNIVYFAFYQPGLEEKTIKQIHKEDFFDENDYDRAVFRESESVFFCSKDSVQSNINNLIINYGNECQTTPMYLMKNTYSALGIGVGYYQAVKFKSVDFSLEETSKITPWGAWGVEYDSAPIVFALAENIDNSYLRVHMDIKENISEEFDTNKSFSASDACTFINQNFQKNGIKRIFVSNCTAKELEDEIYFSFDIKLKEKKQEEINSEKEMILKYYDKLHEKDWNYLAKISRRKINGGDYFKRSEYEVSDLYRELSAFKKKSLEITYNKEKSIWYIAIQASIMNKRTGEFELRTCRTDKEFLYKNGNIYLVTVGSNGCNEKVF